MAEGRTFRSARPGWPVSVPRNAREQGPARADLKVGPYVIAESAAERNRARAWAVSSQEIEVGRHYVSAYAPKGRGVVAQCGSWRAEILKASAHDGGKFMQATKMSWKSGWAARET